MTGPFIELTPPAAISGGQTIVINAAHIETIEHIPGGHAKVALCGGRATLAVHETPDQILEKLNDAMKKRGTSLHLVTDALTIDLTSSEPA